MSLLRGLSAPAEPFARTSPLGRGGPQLLAIDAPGRPTSTWVWARPPGPLWARELAGGAPAVAGSAWDPEWAASAPLLGGEAWGEGDGERWSLRWARPPAAGQRRARLAFGWRGDGVDVVHAVTDEELLILPRLPTGPWVGAPLDSGWVARVCAWVDGARDPWEAWERGAMGLAGSGGLRYASSGGPADAEEGLLLDLVEAAVGGRLPAPWSVACDGLAAIAAAMASLVGLPAERWTLDGVDVADGVVALGGVGLPRRFAFHEVAVSDGRVLDLALWRGERPTLAPWEEYTAAVARPDGGARRGWGLDHRAAVSPVEADRAWIAGRLRPDERAVRCWPSPRGWDVLVDGARGLRLQAVDG